MKKLIIFILILIIAGCRRNGSGPMTTTLDTVNVGTGANTGNGDPLRNAFLKINTAVKFVNTSVVKYSDTAAMIARYIARHDTALMLSHYLQRKDSASMLSHYIQRKDTASMLANYVTRIGLRVKVSDTATMLGHYIQRKDTASMLAHYLQRKDSASMLSRYIERKDTALMLSHYLQRRDSASMLLHYIQRKDTASRLAYYLQRSKGVSRADSLGNAPGNYVTHKQLNDTISISSITTIPTIYSAAGDTSNHQVPGKVGNIFINTVTGDVYISVKAIRHDGWVKVN